MPLFHERPKSVHATQWTGKNRLELGKWILEQCPQATFDFSLDGRLTIVDWLGTVSLSAGYWILFWHNKGFECVPDDEFRAKWRPADCVVFDGPVTEELIKALKAQNDERIIEAPSRHERRSTDDIRLAYDACYGYAAHLFKLVAPQCEPLPYLLGVLTQLDNYIAGLREDLKGDRSATPEEEQHFLQREAARHEQD